MVEWFPWVQRNLWFKWTYRPKLSSLATPRELVGSVDMDKIFLPAYGFPLPKRYRLMDSNVSPNVDVFHLLAFAGTTVVDDINGDIVFDVVKKYSK